MRRSPTLSSRPTCLITTGSPTYALRSGVGGSPCATDEKTYGSLEVPMSSFPPPLGPMIGLPFLSVKGLPSREHGTESDGAGLIVAVPSAFCVTPASWNDVYPIE